MRVYDNRQWKSENRKYMISNSRNLLPSIYIKKMYGFISGMSKRWDKFTLLMWKNWILQYRKPLQTVIEILAPVLFSILLVIVRNLVEPTHNSTLIFEPFCPTSPMQSDVFSFICDLKENSTRRYNISSVGNFR